MKEWKKKKKDALKEEKIHIKIGAHMMIHRHLLYQVLDGRNDGLTSYLNDTHGNSYMYLGVVTNKIQGGKNGRWYLTSYLRMVVVNPKKLLLQGIT